MLRRTAVGLSLCALAVSLQAQPGPLPGSLQIEPVFRQADLVCNCVTRSVTISESARTEAQSKAAWQVKATLEVHDIYKSTVAVAPLVMVEYQQPRKDNFMPAPKLQQGQTALVFLRAVGDHYELLSSGLAITSFSYLPQAQGPHGIEKVRSVLTNVVSGSDRQDRLRALELLEGFDSFDSASLAAIEPLCRSDDPEIAFTALGALLRTKTPESVERLRAYLNSHDYATQPFALVSTGTKLAQIRDIRALPALEDLSSSKFFAVQLGAMDALRAIRSTESIPTLVKRLDDANTTVQYLAVMALAEIEGLDDVDYRPTMNLFDAKPVYYTDLWKKWWEEDGKHKYSP